jgi:hypothetical protein
VRGVSGTWRDLTDSVNSMAVNYRPGPQHRQVATAVAKGDLSQKITVDAKGEVAALAPTMNTHGRPARRSPTRSPAWPARSGTEGKLGRQGGRARRRRHLEGPHRLGELDGRNLTSQVRNIAQIVTASPRAT